MTVADVTVTESDKSTVKPRKGDSVGRLSWAISDSITITWRYLLAYVRLPELLIFTTIQPIMFVLLFRFVFGGAIEVPGIPYVDYLMPGIFVQTVVFGAAGTGIGLAEDASKGLIERFRSLPMARSAVLSGRTSADLVRNVFVVLLMAAVGFIVGFRIHGGVASFALALVITIFFGFSFSWITAIVGLKAPNAETAQAAIFPLLFPLTFASSAFVPVESMPGWLQAFAKHQPVSVVVTAVRGLTLGTATFAQVAVALAWTFGIIVVFAPIAVRSYRKMVS